MFATKQFPNSSDWWAVEAIGALGTICVVTVETSQTAAKDFAEFELRKRVLNSNKPWYEKNRRTGVWEKVLDYVAVPHNVEEDFS